MRIRSAADVIAVAKERGFDVRVRLGPPPMPYLFKPAKVKPTEATEALMEALKAWRLEVIEAIQPKHESNGSH